MMAQTIAHYRILTKIGAGGMGEVYRATDTRLNREVAIKVLPEALARDAERMARFEREAKVLASLNHPNIASIYGLEESNGASALIMELVGGPTLTERIKQGPLALDEALPIAKQIAEGLEYAHERGIIHRDLKPSNVKLTADGQVKVLDFGLAKALEGETSEEELLNSPTLSALATRAGVLLGTAAYMSPEQARGKRVDRRADIWAFGCVLYEMLTGQGPFSGETTSDILACVIRAEPDWPAVPDSVPARIRELLRRCLQKDPRKRLQAIGDARIAMEEAVSGTPQEPGAVSLSGAHALPIRRRAARWAAGILLALVVGYGLWALRPRPSPSQVVQFSFGAPAGDSLVFRLGTTPLAMSPDGTVIAFMLRHNGTSQLYLRRLDRLEATPLKGTDEALYPFFSPDGQWIAFFAGGKLKKVSVLGGTPVTLCDAFGNERGGTWTSNDEIVFAPNATSALMRVSAAGGTPQPFTRLDSGKGERSHRWPQNLPGGQAILFNNSDPLGSPVDLPISLALLRTGEVKTLPVRGANVHYVPGYLLLTRGETLFAVPFDPRRLEVTGSAFPSIEVMISPIGGASFAVSETGSLAYVPAGARIGKLAWVDVKGNLQVLEAPARDYYASLHYSPDGKRIATVIQEGGMRHIWVYDMLRGSLTRLTFGDSDNASPVWSPDGRRIAYLRFKDGNSAIVAKPSDGSGSEETLLPAQKFGTAPTSWSADGKFLAYYQIGSSGKYEAWVLPLDGGNPQPLSNNNQFDQSNPVFSPDGKYWAYMSTETGWSEVYVVPFQQGSGKWQISTGGGRFPVWARNGKQLYYRDNGNVMGVDVTTQPVFRASTPRVVVPAAVTAPLSNGLDNFDVTPDGQRFLIHQQNSETGQSLQINVILNWSEELRRIARAGRQP
jgi:serine/threonine protein kinase/Tol biopolymer transport system component